MIAALKDLFPRIEAWPPEDQQALVEAARGIEAERTGVYQATAEELTAAAHRTCPYSNATRGNIEVVVRAHGGV